MCNVPWVSQRLSSVKGHMWGQGAEESWGDVPVRTSTWPTCYVYCMQVQHKGLELKSSLSLYIISKVYTLQRTRYLGARPEWPFLIGALFAHVYCCVPYFTQSWDKFALGGLCLEVGGEFWWMTGSKKVRQLHQGECCCKTTTCHRNT